MGRPIASPTNLELQASGCRGFRTLGQDLLHCIVVLLSIIVVRISLMCGIVQGHMLATEVRFPHTELTLEALPELSVTHLDAVDVLTIPADHLSGCEPGFGAVGAHRAGSGFRILATLQQGTESMYSNTLGYVDMGLRLDWSKGITGH